MSCCVVSTTHHHHCCWYPLYLSHSHIFRPVCLCVFLFSETRKKEPTKELNELVHTSTNTADIWHKCFTINDNSFEIVFFPPSTALSLSLRRSFSLRLCFCCFVRACNHAMAVFSVQCLHFLAFSYQIKWNNTADSIWSECILIDKNRAKLNGNDSMTTTTTTTMTNANDDNVLNGISQG